MNLRNLISSVSSGLQQGKQNLGNWVSTFTNPTQREEYTQNVVKPTIQKISTVAQMPFNPYGRKEISNFVQSKTNTTIPFNSEEFYGNYKPTQKEEELYNKMDTGYNLINYPTSDSSASLNPYLLAPKSEPRAQVLRDVQINNAGYTPQASQYLKTIPFITVPENAENNVKWAAGGSYSGPNEGSFIEVSKNAYGQQGLAGHELGHQINNVSKSYTPKDFLRDYQLEVSHNPEIMEPITSFIDYYQKSQPEYFGYGENAKNYSGDINDLRNRTLASELYAEIASRFGPEILKSPLLSKYYQGVFQETPENYPGWITPVPTPTQQKKSQPTIKVSQSVKNSGSGKSTKVK